MLISDCALDYSGQSIDNLCRILILVLQECVCTALNEHGKLDILGQIIAKFRTHIIDLLLDECIKFVGEYAVASVVIWEQD